MPFKTVNQQERKNFVEKASQPRVSYINSPLPIFIPQDGSNTIRILPVLAEEKHAELFGITVWTYFIANRLYCSPRIFSGKSGDPISDKFFEVRRTDEAAAEKYRGSRRFVMHILDLNDEKNPILKIWPAPISLVDDIIAVSQLTRSGKIIPVEHPTEGRKIFFKKQGAGMGTKYAQMIIDDEPYPIEESLCDSIQLFQDIIKVDSEEVLKNLVKSEDD